ncbi:thiamine pyrophosphate enzyme, N-terminal TPP binding domain-containing protein [Macrophomina phaseolina]|uniref:Thiamine pyrophosphate enzyme, N-terminal TPP binding domain-containing protein n=1 Tax=Macrophomina phaseolina TaxID=35725 RepID=A0ABQ8FR43_9PEZI|nr:thiamine pyrophosphate enzyme, N-terminal TPP binding domain-containing protein [Macrophomina phaseolina]
MVFPLTTPQNRDLTGGDLLAQSLKKLGTDVAFGLHGGHLDAFLLGCDSIGIKLVDTRHETVAVQAAEGYSKMTGKTGICFVTANSGFSNGLPGLATAFADRSSILCITSSVPLRDQENNSLQGQIDQVVVSKPLTKFAHRVTSAEDLPRLVAHAVHVSVSGSPGPVLLDVPIDVLFAPVSPSRISWGSISSYLPYPPGPHQGAIEEAVNLLKQAKRPAIIIGTGANSPDAASALSSFASATRIPIFSGGKFTILTPLYSNSSFAGPASLLSALSMTAKPSDCILLIGGRTGMYLGGQSGAIIPNHDCRIIQIDTDGGELGRTFPVLGIVSDAAQALHALTAASRQAPFSAPDDWLQAIQSAQSLPSPHADAPSAVPETGLLHPHHALTALFSHLPPNPIVVLDGGEAALWAGAACAHCKPAALISSTGYLGFLGNGFGYALGCAVAAPDTPVVLVEGDGSAGFHFMELDTFARHGLRVLTVVVNNECWGMSVNGQDLVYGGKTEARPVSGLSGGLDYSVVAKGLGCEGVKCTKLEEIGPGVRGVLAKGRPACVDLRVSRKPVHPATEAMVAMTDDPNMIVVPYYDNVPRPHYKL